jgi:hypothetical protein
MRDLAVLFLHLLATVARLAGPGGARAVVAESVLVKHQLLILNRSRKRAPSLRFADRIVAGVCALLMRPGRLIRSAIVLTPSTLLRLHRALTTRKYRLLFSSKVRKKPGPKGPNQDVMAAVVEMKQRNPTWGCPRIAHQIVLALSRQNVAKCRSDSETEDGQWSEVYRDKAAGGLTRAVSEAAGGARSWPCIARTRRRPYCARTSPPRTAPATGSTRLPARRSRRPRRSAT